MAEDREPLDWLGVGAPTQAQPQVPTGRQGVARRRWAGAGLLAAGLVGGGVLAGTLGASAASNTSSSGSASSVATYGGGAPSAANGTDTGPRGGRDHGSNPVRGDEKSLSSSLTATLTQKAKAAVPGGTVYRVESDSGDATYEAHMTKSDGSEVTVKFDKNGNVTGVEAGMGKGDPNDGGPGGRGPGVPG